MSDVTLLYYTANRIGQSFADVVRDELVAVAEEFPLVVVAQRPVYPSCDWLPDRLTTVIVGDIGASIYNVYRQILVGAKAALTTYVACCEDDSLYTAEHFAFRPLSDDTFYYNRNRWVITRKLSDDKTHRQAFYYWRERTQMAQCICHRELLIETLEEKFAKYPIPPPSTDVAKKSGWGEPGRYEKNLGLTPRKRAYFDTVAPNVTFNHAESLMGRRKVNDSDEIRKDLPPWGPADDLWNRIHG